jgi:O-acetyl-ADP-ribose deacetylase (regulator of RNase III)
MSNSCPVYINNFCILKEVFNPVFNARLFNLSLSVIQEGYGTDCQGSISLCSFKIQQSELQKEEPTSNPLVEPPAIEAPLVEEKTFTKVSLHQVKNPYLVKADALVYPTNIILTIDDPLLNKMSRNKIQDECDKIRKPYKMGTIYKTSNGGEGSQVKPKHIYHAVVAGESRLVNEEDVKLSVRKALLQAELDNVRNIVMMPLDCGTHDINDIARVHLAAIKTFLSSHPNYSIKNIFVVMEDEESLEVYREYYNRIF